MNAETIMFSILRAEVCGGRVEEDIKTELTPERLEAVFALSKRHDMAHLIGNALGKLGLLRDDEISQKFKSQVMLAVRRYVNMKSAYVQVCRTLEAARIPFIPLKGSVMRKYYPEPWMRTSCDIDILVKEQDLECAIKSFEALGYQNRGRSMYDVSLFSPRGVHIELHFNLITDYVSPKQREILSHLWDCVVRVDGFTYKYAMPDGFFYFYHVAHMAKHFKEGGCGIRPLLDMWILNNRVEYDAEERQDLLAQGGLLTFAKETERLAKVWFADAEMDEALEEIAGFILHNGVFGTYEARITMRERDKRGLRYACLRVFLPYRYLKYQYPVLQKHKWLLPLFEVVRWVRLLFNGGVKRSVREMKTKLSVSEEQHINAVNLLETLGL